jgi:hypothetical protein
MHNFSKKMATALVAAAFVAPMIASADTNASSTVSSDMQAKIQLLLAQIKTLQEQIKSIVGSSTGGGMGWNMGGGMMGSSTMGMPPGQFGKQACISLTRNLKQGDQGDDVKSLQQMLQQDSSSGFTGSATGFFGPLTAKAMMHFQMNNGIASSTDGSVGPLTRGFFDRHCGKGLDGQQGDRMMDEHGSSTHDWMPPPPNGSSTPMGMMPTTNGPQHGPGMNGGPQNW